MCVPFHKKRGCRAHCTGAACLVLGNLSRVFLMNVPGTVLSHWCCYGVMNTAMGVSEELSVPSLTNGGQPCSVTGLILSVRKASTADSSLAQLGYYSAVGPLGAGYGLSGDDI